MNDNILRTILSKLDTIETKIKVLETGEPVASPEPLFDRTLRLMEKHDELSESMLERELKVDKTTASKLLDRLESAGYGKCYFEEA